MPISPIMAGPAPTRSTSFMRRNRSLAHRHSSGSSPVMTKMRRPITRPPMTPERNHRSHSSSLLSDPVAQLADAAHLEFNLVARLKPGARFLAQFEQAALRHRSKADQ